MDMPAYIINQNTGEVKKLSIREFEDIDLERVLHFKRRWRGWKWAVEMTIQDWVDLLVRIRKETG